MSMTERCVILPDARFVSLKAALGERLNAVAATIRPENFASLLDTLMLDVLQRGFAEATAHEGSIWLLDAGGSYLVPAWNNGAKAAEFVCRHRQPLDRGLISMVFASEQPFVENEVYRNQQFDPEVDLKLKLRTCALIEVPFYFLKACRGVISCVQVKALGDNVPDPPGFSPPHLAAVQRTATMLSRLLELRLLGSTVGWDAD